MIYACLTIKDNNDGMTDRVKAVVATKKALNEWMEELKARDLTIVDSFIDYYMGTVCIVPDDFDY